MKENCKKKLFISGPITDTPFYWRAFEEARDFYETAGYAVLNPAELPVGISNADYARICLSMIDSADEVAFLPGWHESVGAKLEHDYCYYIRKPVKLYKDDVKKHFAGSIDAERTNPSGSESDKLSAFAKLFCEEVAKQLDICFTCGTDSKEKGTSRNGEEPAKDTVTIDLTRLYEKFMEANPDESEEWDTIADFAVGQALDAGYHIEFSKDADGWRSISLHPPVQKNLEKLYKEAEKKCPTCESPGRMTRKICNVYYGKI